jgi:hypothetical protein
MLAPHQEAVRLYVPMDEVARVIREIWEKWRGIRISTGTINQTRCENSPTDVQVVRRSSD